MSDLTGTILPSIELASSAGGSVTLPDSLKGKWSLLYFYPKDDTPGCTKQACSYRDNISDFTNLGAQVFGVSLDDLASHAAFKEKFSLNFPLLYDKDKVLSEALEVYGETTIKDRVFKGLSRDTFLINPEGKIAKVYRKVNPLTTVAETLADLKASIG
jgi:thioredoxin-dependent peroxiredoxin